mmetsp:Transcript_4612/g.13029  ORF Transcript_4612/g.13029 Transcript_4612/m.13029 type:complete len:296 (+) Transcript_4612:468-1355(+)
MGRGGRTPLGAGGHLTRAPPDESFGRRAACCCRGGRAARRGASPARRRRPGRMGICASRVQRMLRSCRGQWALRACAFAIAQRPRTPRARAPARWASSARDRRGAGTWAEHLRLGTSARPAGSWRRKQLGFIKPVPLAVRAGQHVRRAVAPPPEAAFFFEPYARLVAAANLGSNAGALAEPRPVSRARPHQVATCGDGTRRGGADGLPLAHLLRGLNRARGQRGIAAHHSQYTYALDGRSRGVRRRDRRPPADASAAHGGRRQLLAVHAGKGRRAFRAGANPREQVELRESGHRL